MKKQVRALKGFRYGTRMLQAGDVFSVSRRDARLLGAIGRAEEVQDREKVELAPPPEPLPESDLDELREKARSVGLHVDRRWRPETLARKIEEADAES